MNQIIFFLQKFLDLFGLILTGIKNSSCIRQKFLLPETDQVRMNLLDLSQFRYGIDLFNGFNGNPSSWYWAYSPPNIGFINGTTAYSQHPQVRFTTNGTYTVTLIEYRGQAVGIKVRTDYIHADIPGLWTGISSSVWFTASNWHNYMVPNSITDVVIPSAAPHWPVFTGNFIIGIHCHNLRLEGGGNCLMTIREN